MDDRLHKITDKHMGLYQAPKGINSMTGHDWLWEVINIEVRIRDSPRKDNSGVFTVGSPIREQSASTTTN